MNVDLDATYRRSRMDKFCKNTATNESFLKKWCNLSLENFTKKLTHHRCILLYTLGKFYEQLFHRTLSNRCFCKDTRLQVFSYLSKYLSVQSQ